MRVAVYFAGELQDHIGERRTIATLASGFLHRPAKFLIDHPLHAFESRSGGELLLDEVVGTFEGDDARGEVAHTFEARMDGRFADAEVTRGIGLRVAGFEVGAQDVVG